MREVIKTAKTVEEATALALAELGVSADDAYVEILEMPHREFLFKKVPAKVRAYIEEEALAEKAVKPASKKETGAKMPKEEKSAPRKEAPKAEKPAVKKEEKPQPAKRAEAKPAKQEKAEKTAAPAEEELPEEPIELDSCPKAKEAVEYLKDVCAKMGAGDITVIPVRQGETVILKVEGESAGTLIGHRGEVMESLSYLVSLVANRAGGDYMKIGLDINHYRSKREANLTALAKRIGAKVQRTGRSHTLEPMNPYERRIIHSAVSEMEGVKSESVGEGANRRVVISSTDAAARPQRENRRGTRGPRQGGRTNRAPRKDSERAPRNSTPAREFADRPRDDKASPVVPKRTETINDVADLPLYGKIEL